MPSTPTTNPNLPPSHYLWIALNIGGGVVAGWLTKKGMRDSDAAELVGAIVGILFAYISAVAQGTVLFKSEPPTEASPTPELTADDVGINVPPAERKRDTYGKSLALLLPLLLIVGVGCQSSPVKSIAAAEISFKAATDAITYAAKTERIRDPKVAKLLQDSIRMGDAALDAARSKLSAGQPQNVQMFLDQVLDLIRRIEVILQTPERVSWASPKSSPSPNSSSRTLAASQSFWLARVRAAA